MGKYGSIVISCIMTLVVLVLFIGVVAEIFMAPGIMKLVFGALVIPAIGSLFLWGNEVKESIDKRRSGTNG